jgi:hypothetical protein
MSFKRINYCLYLSHKENYLTCYYVNSTLKLESQCRVLFQPPVYHGRQPTAYHAPLPPNHCDEVWAVINSFKGHLKTINISMS